MRVFGIFYVVMMCIVAAGFASNNPIRSIEDLLFVLVLSACWPLLLPFILTR